MSENGMSCDLCKKEIPFGAAYIALCYNIEQMNRNVARRQNYVQVIKSDQILTMCGKCGNRNSASAVKNILKVTTSCTQALLN